MTSESSCSDDAFTSDEDDNTEENGWTALHRACQENKVSAVKQLLKEGADKESRTTIGQYTPLLVAAKARHIGVVQVLLEAGANVNAQTTHGKTTLWWATENNFTKMAKLLILSNANLKHKDNKGYTPFHNAGIYR